MRFSALACVVVITLIAGVSFASSDAPPAKISTEVRLFTQIDNTPGMDAFARGLQESLSNALARTSRFSQAGSGARYVLSGSFQVVGTDVRINATLAEASSTEPVAAFRVIGPVRETFELQSELEQQFIRKLVSLHPREEVTGAPFVVRSTGPLRTSLVTPEFLAPAKTLDRSYDVSRRNVQFEYPSLMRPSFWGRYGHQSLTVYPMWWFH